MRFEIYKKQEGLIGGIQWRWRLVASNGKNIASGEGYNNKQDCLHAIELLQGTTLLTPIAEVDS